MKKIIILIFFSSVAIFSQELVTGEVIFWIFNKGGYSVTFRATKEVNFEPIYYARFLEGREHLWGKFVEVQEEFNNVDATAGPGLNSIFFDTEGDDDSNIVGLSIYKIKAIGDHPKNASFYLNTLHCDEWIDTYITYDYANDIFYLGDCHNNPASCVNIITSSDTIYPFNPQLANCLEIYLTVTAQNGSPYLQWNSSRQTGYTSYNIYRCINETPTIFTLISTTSNTYFLDEDLSAGNTWKVWYKVIAKNNSNELG